MNTMRVLILPLALIATALAQTLVCDSLCQKGCDLQCQSALQRAFDSEAAQWVGRVVSDPYFATPANFSASSAKPGDILRWEDISEKQLSTNWTVPASLSLSRYLYVSEDGHGTPVPASGWVLLPYAAPPSGDGKLRTVVWAHGTAGLGRQCASINYKALYTEWQAPLFLAELGYAVVAPDYAGQGSETASGFVYAAGVLHALDVAYAMVAARKGLGDLLGSKWAVYGHSEGGLSAWRTNELLAAPSRANLRRQTGDFVGAVAASPALRPYGLIATALKKGANSTDPSKNPYAVWLLQVLEKLYPEQIRAADWLGEVPLQRLGAMDQGCWRTGMAAVGNLTVQQLLRNTSWLEHPVMEDFRTRYNGEGPHPLAAPMLVVHGESDSVVTPKSMLDDVNQTCTKDPNSSVQVRLYPDMDHGQVVDAAKGDIMTWLAGRFAGKTAPNGCRTETVVPLTGRHGRTKIVWTGKADEEN